MISKQENHLNHLINKIAQRNPNAFVQFYDLLAPDAFGVIHRVVKSKKASEKILQDVFYTVWQKAANFIPDHRTPKDWVITITRDCLKDHLGDEENKPLTIDTLEPVTPPENVRACLLEKISTSPAKSLWIPRLAMALGLLASITAAIYPYWVDKTKAKTGAANSRSVKSANPHNPGYVKLKNTTKVMPDHDKQMQEIFKSPGMSAIKFKDTADEKKVKVWLLWNSKACGGCLTIEGLSKILPEETYEFWAIDESGPVPAGTFRVMDDGKAHLDIRGIVPTRNFNKFTVTKEPRDGSTSPTGPIVLSSL